MAERAQIIDPVVLIRVPRLFRSGMSTLALYEATRGVWKIGPRRDLVKYALTVHEGIVQEVVPDLPLAAGVDDALHDKDLSGSDRARSVGVRGLRRWPRCSGQVPRKDGHSTSSQRRPESDHIRQRTGLREAVGDERCDAVKVDVHGTTMSTKYSARWPFRQSDPAWGKEVMWDRAIVMAVHKKHNRGSHTSPKDLLARYDDGNTLSNEGCLITCLAMVLRILDDRGSRWTPLQLHRKAQDLLYYSKSGLSNVPLYADLVADVSDGDVQVCVQEQYLSGVKPWPRTFASGCMILRVYRALAATARRDFTIMLKIGTHDDTSASHYVLVDPDAPGEIGDDDVPVLDPALTYRAQSRQVDADVIPQQYLKNEDGDIKKQWRHAEIRSLQLSGVWAFARWRTKSQTALGATLFRALVQQVDAAREQEPPQFFIHPWSPIRQRRTPR